MVLGITPSTKFVYSLENVPRHILFYYLVLRKSYEKERGYPL